MSQSLEAKTIAECFQKAYLNEATDIEDIDDLPELVLVDLFLSSCMVVFLTQQWILQESQADRSATLPVMNEIISQVQPKQYLEPEMRKRSLPEAYVFMLILESALRIHTQYKPDHERVDEVHQLHTLVASTLNYKYFHQVEPM